MSTISSTLSLAKRALVAHQGAMAAGGDNVANVNTPGYARRKADLQTGPTDRMQFGGLGSGVDLLGVISERDRFVESQLHRSMGESSWYDAGQEQLQMIESVAGDTGSGGISDALNAFWNSWHDLSADPSSTAQRNVVRQNAQRLVQQFRDLDSNLSYRSSQLDAQIASKTGDVNAIAKQLADLNKDFSRSRKPSADLEDRRTALLDQLAKLVDIQYQVKDNGSVSVFIAGNALVMDDRAAGLKVGTGADGKQQVLLADSGVELNIAGGEIGALFHTRDSDLVDLRTKLDDVAKTLATEVNKIHRAGYGTDGSTGNNFFADGVTGISDIKLDDSITQDLSKIAAGGNTLPGDNSTALAMAELEGKAVMNGGRDTIGAGFAGAQAWLGARVADNAAQGASAQAALQQAQNWRESVSGVSLDEEMADMVRSQQAFNAAAKLVTATDTMMQTLITMVG